MPCELSPSRKRDSFGENERTLECETSATAAGCESARKLSIDRSSFAVIDGGDIRIQRYR